MSFIKKIFHQEEQNERKQPELPLHVPVKQLARPEDEIDLEDIWVLYHHKRIVGQKEGFTPILFHGSEMLLETIQECIPAGETHLPLTPVGDGKAWLAKQYEELTAQRPQAEEKLPEKQHIVGTNRFISLQQELRSDTPLYLAEIPTSNPWEVPAWLPFGGWNECPVPEDMMAVLRHWYETYGAVPACISHDTLELFVPEPVSPEAAQELAKEQYAFCSDIVDQGIGSVAALAEELKKSMVWFFWWD